jgi:hypothetical protein
MNGLEELAGTVVQRHEISLKMLIVYFRFATPQIIKGNLILNIQELQIKGNVIISHTGRSFLEERLTYLLVIELKIIPPFRKKSHSNFPIGLS